jgi:hypothetical protein
MPKMKMHYVYATLGVIVLLLVLLFAYTWVIQPNVTGAPKLKTGSVGGTSPTQAPSTTTSTSGAALPINFILTDPLAGGAIASPTLKVYTSNLALTDTLTSSTQTATVWTPGTTGYVAISKTNYISQFDSFTVPSVATTGQYGAEVYSIPITDSLLGTYSILAVDNYGNTYSGATWNMNFSSTGGGTLAAPITTITFTCTIYNTAINTGYVTTYDHLNNVNQACGITMSTAGSSVSVPTGISGLSQAQTFPRGTSTYWSAVVPDSGLTNQKIGQVQTLPGSVSFTITINKAALVHTAGGTTANTQAFTIGLYAPFDSSYYAANGIGGPNTGSSLVSVITLNCKV